MADLQQMVRSHMLIGQDLIGEQVLKTTFFTRVSKNKILRDKFDETCEKHIQRKLQNAAERN